MTQKLDRKIAFLGGGAMAEALIRGIINAGLAGPETLAVSEISDFRRRHLSTTLGIQVFSSNAEAVAFGDILVLAVKPNVIPTVLDEIGRAVRADQLVISIAAGVTLEKIEAKLAQPVPVIRVMPNTPALVGEGASALCRGMDAEPEHMDTARRIFGAVGLAVEVPESLMDAVTGLSGSGPAYAFMAIEALADGGVRAGLPRAIAIDLAAQTLLGAAKMVRETGKHPGELKDMVTSPGGTTIAGVAALEKAGMRSAFIEAVAASSLRAKELGKG